MANKLLRRLLKYKNKHSFRPENLFRQGEDGFIFDISRDNLLYTDKEGVTTLASLNGYVGRVRSTTKTGVATNVPHYMQGHDTNLKPILRENVWGRYLEFTSTNGERLELNVNTGDVFSFSSPCTMVFVVRPTETASVTHVLIDVADHATSPTERLEIFLDANGEVIRMRANSEVTGGFQFSAFPFREPIVMVCDFSPTSPRMFINGVEERNGISFADTSPQTGMDVIATVGNNVSITGSVDADMELYDLLYINRSLTDKEIEDLTFHYLTKLGLNKPYCREAKKYFDACPDVSELTNIQKRHINHYIIDLIASGVWEKLDGLVIGTQDTTLANALVDVKRLVPMTDNGGINWSISGLRSPSNGVYIDTGYNPSVDAVNMSQDDACVFSFCGGLSTSSEDDMNVVADDGTAKLGVFHRNSSVQRGGFCNSNTMVAGTQILTGIEGFSLCQRTSNDTVVAYENDRVSATDAANTSIGLPNTNILIGGSTTGAAANNYVSIAGWGASLTLTEIRALFDASHHYLISQMLWNTVQDGWLKGA